ATTSSQVAGRMGTGKVARFLALVGTAAPAFARRPAVAAPLGLGLDWGDDGLSPRSGSGWALHPCLRERERGRQGAQSSGGGGDGARGPGAAFPGREGGGPGAAGDRARGRR